jgi:hypothetical protein
MRAAALRRAATILAVKGGTLREITVGDCLELSVAIDGRSLRANKGMGFYQLLHAMGVFGPHAPSTIRAFGTRGQLSPAQLIDRYGLRCRPIRDVLVAYLAERQPMLDHTTLRDLAFSLGALFWRDLERHHPGIDSLDLPPEVATAWKQRLRHVRDRDSRIVRERVNRIDILINVRSLYLDLAQWAVEEPSRWGTWVAPCPISAAETNTRKYLAHRKARMDQRTRDRLPVLPTLVRTAEDRKHSTRQTVHSGRTRVPATAPARQPAFNADLGRRPRYRRAPRHWHRGRTRFLGLGGDRGAAAHRSAHRGTARAHPPQLRHLHPPVHR